eukprot:GEMP01019593.1.p1 GENE.GEMP01019593.1~~GEMP01019593.1.p1  ORF type:complete len:470 (+),score=77.51 GEMP01019593.1:137-1546(+)
MYAASEHRHRRDSMPRSPPSRRSSAFGGGVYVYGEMSRYSANKENDAQQYNAPGADDDYPPGFIGCNDMPPGFLRRRSGTPETRLSPRSSRRPQAELSPSSRSSHRLNPPGNQHDRISTIPWTNEVSLNCFACRRPFDSRRYVKCGDRRFHEACFYCVKCNRNLVEQQYKMDEHGPACLHCFCKKCEKCHQPIIGEMLLACDLDKVNHAYHPNCLQCALCGAALLSSYRATRTGFTCPSCPAHLPSKVPFDQQISTATSSTRSPSCPSWQEVEPVRPGESWHSAGPFSVSDARLYDHAVPAHATHLRSAPAYDYRDPSPMSRSQPPFSSFPASYHPGYYHHLHAPHVPSTVPLRSLSPFPHHHPATHPPPQRPHSFTNHLQHVPQPRPPMPRYCAAPPASAAPQGYGSAYNMHAHYAAAYGHAPPRPQTYAVPGAQQLPYYHPPHVPAHEGGFGAYGPPSSAYAMRRLM